MIVLTSAESWETCKPGQWVLRGEELWLLCPKCEQPVRLRRGDDAWTVFDDGEVLPSVNMTTCGFHEFIKLADWKK